jgi:monovalent cation/proton antiporter MnhG/PhaG subunit
MAEPAGYAEYVAAALVLAGGLVTLVAAIGVHRLPDAFLRMHAATKAGVVGASLILLGLAVAEGSVGTWIKVLCAVGFLSLTVPIASHALGRAAYVGGAPMARGTDLDELEGVLPRQGGPAAPPPDPRGLAEGMNSPR